MAYQKVLVNGCSFSRGPESWPYQSTITSGPGLVNLAMAGAGNTYIHETTMTALSDRDYDFVAVMWSAPGRLDFPVTNPDGFPPAQTSRYQSEQNDWPEKITIPFDDRALAEKNWVFTGDYGATSGPMAPVLRFMTQWRNRRCVVRQTLIRMLSLQSYLKQRKIPYVFSLFIDYSNELSQHQNLWQQLDQQRFFRDVNLADLARSLSSYESDGVHPGPKAHSEWAQAFDSFILKENLYHA